MRLTTIGTGTAAPHPSRVQSGALIEAGEVRALLDCGSGVLSRMAQFGLDWQGVTHVVLTHFHADHTADLAGLLTAWRWGQLPPRSAPVTLVGPPGTRDFFARVAAAFEPALASYVPGFSIIELPARQPLALDGATVECCEVPHSAGSVAWRFDADGARLTCSGDTGPSDDFADWARRSDLLLLECSLPASFGATMHLSPEACGAIAARAEPAALWLTHFYPPVESTDIEGLVGARWTGPVVRAHDGASVTIGRAGNAHRSPGYA